MTADLKLLAAKTEDLFKLCDKYACPRFSDFLDGAEQAFIKDEVIFPAGFNVLTYGGFDDSEKKMIGVFPEWQEPLPDDFPIACLKIECREPLAHRDCLGAIMSLGITPSKLGDIVVNDCAAYAFAHKDIAGYISENISKIGSKGVNIALTEAGSVTVERRYAVIETVCASARLDAVAAAAANISRSDSAKLIASGKVKLNHRECTKTAAEVHEGDILSLRGFGRFIAYRFGSETRNKRIHLTIKKYI